MPRLKIKKEPIAAAPEPPFEIREEIVRWDNVKTAHDLQDDMEVAQMLLNCYDLVGGSFLVWSDKAKLAPPPLAATLRLQYVSEEGWQVLQEIKALGGWAPWSEKTSEKTAKKSRRKQAKVRHIVVKVETEKPDEEDSDANDDAEYIPQGSRSRPKAQKQDDDDFVPELQDVDDDDDEEYIPKPAPPAPRKRGRPRKGEVRPPKPERKKKVTKPKKNSVTPTKNPDGTSENPDAPSDSAPDTEEGSSKPPKQPRKKKEKSGEETVKKTKHHIKRTHRIYKCKLCSVMCESQVKFRIHFATHLEPEKQDYKKHKINVLDNSILFFKCKICNIILSENEVKLHRGRHGNAINKICHTCGKIFTCRSSWDRHQQIHVIEKTGKKLACKICGKQFALRKTLSIHMGKHSKDRPFVCEKCGKAFKHYAALHKHRHIHTNVKRLSCEFCGKGFNRRDNLKAHVRTHTGDKPFRCDICSAAFTHNVSLKTHKRSSHGIDMWKDQKPQVVDEYDINLEDLELLQKSSDTVSGEMPVLKRTQSEDTMKNKPLPQKIKHDPSAVTQQPQPVDETKQLRTEHFSKSKMPSTSTTYPLHFQIPFSMFPIDDPQSSTNYPPLPRQSLTQHLQELHHKSPVQGDGKRVGSFSGGDSDGIFSQMRRPGSQWESGNEEYTNL